MSKLTISASNWNRMSIDSPSTQYFIKSLQRQDTKDFEIQIIDGGSDNQKELKNYIESYNGTIPMRMITYDMPKEHFLKCLLNNISIRNAKTEYIMTTDVDILFEKEFVSTLMGYLRLDTFIESRALYWKDSFAKKVYNGEYDPFIDFDACKNGRIKYRTTPGACQCMHKSQWEKLRGYDENYIGWGSEDMDLFTRASKMGLKVIWLGETREDIMIIHQPHAKDVKKDLEYQEENKKRLRKIKDYKVNPNGWGNITE